jgi:hypothetical protein
MRLDELDLTYKQLDLHRVNQRLSAVARVLRMNLRPEELPRPHTSARAPRGS